jgi:AbrB family looped-hinge helix DNA binding protein
MDLITTITSKGQVTIPSHIRHSLEIKAGDQLMVSGYSVKTQEVTLKLLPKRSLTDLYGALYQPGMKYIPIQEARRLAGIALAKKYQVKTKP